MKKKNATSAGLMAKAELLLDVSLYMEHGDEEDLKFEHYRVLEYVRLLEKDSYDNSVISSGSVVYEARKMYRRAFRRLRKELKAAGGNG